MSEDAGPSPSPPPPPPPSRCAFCDYDLAGLPGDTCPECGETQPPPTKERLVRADRVWLVVLLTGVAVFAGLAKLSLSIDLALGAMYSGDLQMEGFTVVLAVVSAAYAIGAFEVFTHRARLRRMQRTKRSQIGCLFAAPWTLLVTLLAVLFLMMLAG